MKPVFMTKDELLAVLDDIRAAIAANDSFEGSIEYLLPDDGDAPDGFRVQGVYRIGNSMGQGGARMIGEMGV